MQKKLYLFLPVFVLVLLSSMAIIGQSPVKPVVSPGQKYKKPLVKSSIGKVTGIVALSPEIAAQAIIQPLRITDGKNVDYVISSYQFVYKRIGVTQDEETGKTSAQSDIAADRFTTTPLPPVWQQNIVNGLHSGEELYFFDIIVFDKQGRRFFAPEIKISIQ